VVIETLSTVVHIFRCEAQSEQETLTFLHSTLHLEGMNCFVMKITD
jgi:hypothetical protein